MIKEDDLSVMMFRRKKSKVLDLTEETNLEVSEGLTAIQEAIPGLAEECGDTESEETHQFPGGEAP